MVENCWPIPDGDGARVRGVAVEGPSPLWGRDQLGTWEMWNSNSVIAWLLARAEQRLPEPAHAGSHGRI